MSASENPALSDGQLQLEPLIARHADALFTLLADHELWRYTDDRSPESIDSLRDRYRRLEGRRAPDGTELWLNWAVSSAAHGYVGFVQATIFEQRGEAEIAYVIARSFWSLGIGSQAVRILLRFLQDRQTVKIIRATVDNRNLASLRLLQKLDFSIVDDGDCHNYKLERVLFSG